MIVEDMGQPLFVFGTNRKNFGAKVRGTYVNHLYVAGKLSTAIQFNRKVKRVAVLDEQAAFDSHSIFADIYDSTGR